MKAEKLVIPFPWEERRVYFNDRLFYVPQYYEKYHEFPCLTWYSEEIFKNFNPVHIEFCSGNGAWIIEKALSSPHINWVAVEMKFERIRKIWSKMKTYQLNNLLVVCGEALITTQNFFPSNTVQEIYINFPDPWPKNYHMKHRLISPAFLTEMARILKNKGTIDFVTDDEAYSQWTIAQFQKDARFASSHPAPFYSNQNPGYGSSYFEELWRGKGKQIRYHRFCKS